LELGDTVFMIVFIIMWAVVVSFRNSYKLYAFVTCMKIETRLVFSFNTHLMTTLLTQILILIEKSKLMLGIQAISLNPVHPGTVFMIVFIIM